MGGLLLDSTPVYLAFQDQYAVMKKDDPIGSLFLCVCVCFDQEVRQTIQRSFTSAGHRDISDPDLGLYLIPIVAKTVVSFGRDDIKIFSCQLNININLKLAMLSPGLIDAELKQSAKSIIKRINKTLISGLILN
jgi:hypothetical protein